MTLTVMMTWKKYLLMNSKKTRLQTTEPIAAPVDLNYNYLKTCSIQVQNATAVNLSEKDLYFVFIAEIFVDMERESRSKRKYPLR